MIPLVEELNEIRKQANMSFDALALETGYQPGNVKRWFRGCNRPLLSSFIDTANALGYDVVLVKRKAAA